eukprot:gene13543-4431_t
MGKDTCAVSNSMLKSALPVETYFIAGLHLSIIPISICLNGVIMFLISTKRCLRTKANAMIFNMCVVDLSFTFTGRLIFASNVITLSNDLCKSGMYVGHTTIALSVYALCCLTFERYVAIFYPYRYPRYLTRRNIAIGIGFSWMIPCTVGSLTFIPDVDSETVLFALAANNIALVIFILTLTARIIYAVFKIEREIRSTSARFSNSLSRKCLLRSSRGIRLLTVAMMLIFCCYTPLSLTTLFHFEILSTGWLRRNIIAITLASFSDIINPILIILSTNDIRVSLMRLPKCRRF